MTYQPCDVVFAQGNAADDVKYLQEGTVKLSVVSHGGREAVVASALKVSSGLLGIVLHD